MKSLKKVHINQENISYVFLLILCFYPLMTFSMISKSIIGFLLISILFFFKDFKSNFKAYTIRPLLINAGFYLVMLLTIVYSSNKDYWLREAIKGLPFLLIPFIFFYIFPKLSKQKINYLLLTFVISNFLFFIRSYHFFIKKLSALERFNFKGESYFNKLILIAQTPFSKITANAVNVKNNPPDFFFHKAYISMIFLFSICIVIYLVFKTKFNWLLKGFLVICAILFTFSVFHYFSIPNLFGLLTIIPILIVLNINSKKGKIAVIGSIVFASVLLFSSNSFHQRIIRDNGIQKNIAQLKRFVKDPISYSPDREAKKARSMINYCSAKLFESQPIFGYGIGDANDMSYSCYENSDYIEGVLYEYNTHNYYFYLLIAGGIILLIVFLMLLGNNLFIAVKYRDWLFIGFILIISINLMSENVLSRAHGIIFFTLFNALFYKNNSLNFTK